MSVVSALLPPYPCEAGQGPFENPVGFRSGCTSCRQGTHTHLSSVRDTRLSLPTAKTRNMHVPRSTLHGRSQGGSHATQLGASLTAGLPQTAACRAPGVAKCHRKAAAERRAEVTAAALDVSGACSGPNFRFAQAEPCTGEAPLRPYDSAAPLLEIWCHGPAKTEQRTFSRKRVRTESRSAHRHARLGRETMWRQGGP